MIPVLAPCEEAKVSQNYDSSNKPLTFDQMMALVHSAEPLPSDGYDEHGVFHVHTLHQRCLQGDQNLPTSQEVREIEDKNEYDGLGLVGVVDEKGEGIGDVVGVPSSRELRRRVGRDRAWRRKSGEVERNVSGYGEEGGWKVFGREFVDVAARLEEVLAEKAKSS
jgi:hypothetical protein